MTKQHPNHDQIVALIQEGLSNRAIHGKLGGCRRVMAKIRAGMGREAFTHVTPVEEQLKQHCTPADRDGHVAWTGGVNSAGNPRIRHNGRDLPVSRVVFERQNERKPEGQVRADCGVRGCVAPSHLADELGRRKVRLVLRAIYLYPPHWDNCPACGGSWDEEGRVDNDLSVYCRRCNSSRRARNKRKAAK